jgi:5-methylcytosine-specific restriction endonuclease McrA
MPYVDYLETPEWDQMRQTALFVADYRCQVCNRDDETLDVHHRTYERLGQELLEDLFVLCRSCHLTYHVRLPIAE